LGDNPLRERKGEWGGKDRPGWGREGIRWREANGRCHYGGKGFKERARVSVKRPIG
jgi:hypothetical protein